MGYTINLCSPISLPRYSMARILQFFKMGKIANSSGITSILSAFYSRYLKNVIKD